MRDTFKCGHPRTDNNVYFTAQFKKSCKTCHDKRTKRYKKRPETDLMNKRIRYWTRDRIMKDELNAARRRKYYQYRNSRNPLARLMYGQLINILKREDPLYKPRKYGVMPPDIVAEIQRRKERKKWLAARRKMLLALFRETPSRTPPDSPEKDSEEPPSTPLQKTSAT